MAELDRLERELEELGGDLEWPGTPNLRASVGPRLAARRHWYQNRLALAAVALILAVAALFAYTPSRDAIANWINLHVRIQRTTELPTPSPPPPGPLGQRLGLGGQTTMTGAQAAVGWKVLVPSSLGQPDEVYLQQPPGAPSQGEVTLVYGTRPDIAPSSVTGVAALVTEARGSVNQDYFGKMLGPGTTLELVTEGGHQGYWIEGEPHVFFLVDADGNIIGETLRLATNTLIIDDGGTVVRIEGNLTKAQALQIAASLS
jgi:hypothetical protein